jgi:hypothetical protein
MELVTGEHDPEPAIHTSRSPDPLMRAPALRGAAHGAVDFPDLLACYQRTGLLPETLLQKLRPELPHVAETWRRLNAPSSEVGFTLVVRGPKGQVGGAISGVRPWEQAWLIQHLAADFAAGAGVSSALTCAVCDFIRERPEMQYTLFFVDTNNRLMNAYQEKFFSRWEDSRSVGRILVTYWIFARRPATPPPADSAITVRTASTDDEPLVAWGAKQALGELAASALSLTPGSITLPQASRAFACADLARSRSALVVANAGGPPAVALVRETSSIGVNLTGVLDAHWLVPLEAPLGEDAAAAAASACTASVPEGGALLVPHGVCTRALQERGFCRLLDYYLYVLDRAGLARYEEYMRSRYSALRERLKRRIDRSR